jgi:hypothetical protein
MEIAADTNRLAYWDIKDIKDKAKVAKTINWHKVMDMMLKFDESSPMIMAAKWDHEIDMGIKKKPFPFHRNYRINLEKMLHTGCFTPKQAERLIEYAKSLRLDRSSILQSEEEVE